MQKHLTSVSEQAELGITLVMQPSYEFVSMTFQAGYYYVFAEVTNSAGGDAREILSGSEADDGQRSESDLHYEL